MKTVVRLAGAVAATILVSAPVWAEENGLEHYPIGVNTVANALLPLPGMLTFQDYNVATWSDDLRDGDGHRINTHFRVNAQVNAMRFLYTWKNLKIGPFHYTTGFVPPIIHSNAHIGGARGDSFNVGDVDIQNYFTHASRDGKFFYYFGLETYIPTGRYNKDKLVNAGNNYWTFAPDFNLTYMPSPRFEVSATLIAQFNTVNPATHYYSGASVDLDWGTTFRPFRQAPKLGFGAQGYFYKQVEDDTVAGARVGPDGNRGQEFGIGPQIRYDLPFGGLALKYQHSFAVENRARSDKIWFQFAFPLAGKPKAL